MQTIKKHTFKRVDAEATAHAYGEDLADAKRRNFTHGDGWEYTGTEEVPYLLAGAAHAIAEALPGNWTVGPQSEEHPNCGWDLIREDGLTLYMHGPAYGHAESYSFGLHAPRHNGDWVEAYDETTRERLPNPSINCAVTKSKEQLAKDIVRRLLPDAENVHAAIMRRIHLLDRHAKAKDQAIVVLAGAGGVPVPSTNYSNERPLYLDGVTLIVGSDGTSVQIAGYINFDKAVRIAAILKKKGAK